MEIKVLVEISQGSNVKYELDHDTGRLSVDRFLYTSMSYPFNYGFIPETLADDGDPVDVIVVSQQEVLPGSMIKAIPIGVLLMEDEEGQDEKIVAVPTKKIDPLMGAYQEIEELPNFIKDKIKHFFENYKNLEPGKWVKIKDWAPRTRAEEIINKSFRTKNQG